MRAQNYLIALIIAEMIALIAWGISGNIEELKRIPFVWSLCLILPVLAIFAIFVAERIGRKVPVIFQIAKFLLVGVSNTFVDLGVLNFLLFLLNAFSGWQYSLAKALSVSVAIMNSYFWNKFWTFQKKETGITAGEILRFYLMTGIGFLINVTIASALVNMAGPQFGLSVKIWANLSAIFAAICTATWSFTAYKFFIFKK